ncbi:MAG: SDR family NAD(P)-dependent oxidoreductase [Planctomycetales bacterium]|nr:SDR family NAD(P)-dependent oxidoreductase [Planctomycetales bacterium]
MPHRSLSGFRVLVTGASSGIGRELVLELARQGTRVVAMARREEKLISLEKEALSLGHTIHIFPGDVTDQRLRFRALEFCSQRLGGLDCLVNNAGIGAIGPFEQADEARLRKIMEVNFFAPVEFARAALPILRQGNLPLLVNVSSVLGHRAVPFKSEYCASKFALHGFSDALRAELARDKIDVLLVSPSTTQSEFFEHVLGNKEKPRGRFGAMTPAKVARRIAWAMRSGRHEIILPLGGRLLVWLDRLCPPLADRLVSWFG